MKNKFLLMAVVSALAALVIVPSAMAVDTGDETTVDATIGSGSFYVVASGAFNTASIGLGAVSVLSSDQHASSTQNTAVDYFQLVDYSGGATNGGKLSISIDGDFMYDDTILGGLDIPFEGFTYAAQYDGGVQGAASCLVSADTNACRIVASQTSSVARDVSLYAFSGEQAAAGPETISMTDVDYFSSSTLAPYVVNVGLEHFDLLIPANSVQGGYSATLYILANDSKSAVIFP